MRASNGHLRRILTGLAVLYLGLGLLLTGCGDEPNKGGGEPQYEEGAPEPKSGEERFSDAERAVIETRAPFSLVLTGGFLGKHKPCGCTKPQMGGLERLGALMDLLDKTRGGVTGIALGWTLAGNGEEQEEAKASFAREAFSVLGFGGVLLGGGDLTVQAMVQPYGDGGVDSPLPPINVVPSPTSFAASGTNVLDMRLDGRRIRAAVVLDPGAEEATDLTARGLARAVMGTTTAFNQARPDPNALWIVAARFTDKESLDALRTALRAQGPAIVVDLSGSFFGTESVGPQPIDQNLSLLVSLDEKGKGVGVLDFFVDESGKSSVQFKHVKLRPELEDGKSPRRDAIQEVLREYLDMVREAGYLANFPTSPPRTDANYVGSARCAVCHKEHYQDWHKEQSHHRAALGTLEDINYHWDPECIRCHVVGWRRNQVSGAASPWVRERTGFVTPADTRHLGGVGCENCHGAGSLHVQDPDTHKMFNGNRDTPGVDGWRRVCVTCHDAENSPGFLEKPNWYFNESSHRRVPSDWRHAVRERMKELLKKPK